MKLALKSGRLFGFCLLMASMLISFNALQAEEKNLSREVEMMDFDAFSHWLERDTDSIYVINFWATWCAPCVRELPAFEKINEHYAEQKVKVLLVSLDNPNQMNERVIPFLEQRNIQSEVLLLDDPNSNRWIPLVSEEWSGAIPATVIYGNGFRAFYEKEFHYEELEDIIKPLLL